MPCPQNAALQVSKGVSLNSNGPFVDSVTTTVGTTVYYQVIVTNTGDVPLTGVTLTDSLGCRPLASSPALWQSAHRSHARTAEWPWPGPRRNGHCDSSQSGPASDTATVIAPPTITDADADADSHPDADADADADSDPDADADADSHPDADAEANRHLPKPTPRVTLPPTDTADRRPASSGIGGSRGRRCSECF